MHIEEEKRPPGLEQGQLWKIEHGYIYIAELGKRLIHYQMLRQLNQRAVPTSLIGIDALIVFLMHSDAELVTEAFAN